MLEIQTKGDEVRLKVHVKPRSARSRVLGVRAGALEVSVAAVPADGRANLELQRTLARQFGVARSAVRIEIGRASRTKLVTVFGLTPAELCARLPSSESTRTS